MVERRVFRGVSVRAKGGEKPGIAGTAAVYNQQYDSGYFIETIKPGAFAKVLGTDPDVRCLFNHDPSKLLGRTKSGTLRLKDAADGLQYECDTDDNTQVGRDVRAMVEREDLDGCSFAFSVGKQSWREEKNSAGAMTLYRDIEEIDALLDVGPVTYPAYEATSVTARSMWPEGVPAEVRSRVPELRSDDERTKRVDEEDLTRDCFLLVGDPDRTDTWALPWKFSTAEKTKTHLRDALARFNQVEGFSRKVMKKAWKKLVMLCEHYGIDVEDKEMPMRDGADGDPDEDDRARTMRLRLAEAE